MQTTLPPTPDADAVLASLQGLVACHTEGEPDGPVSLELPLGESAIEAMLDPYNERIKLYELSARELTEGTLLEERGTLPEDLASKITAYALPGATRQWGQLGFRKEAVIRGYFQDGHDAHLYASYTDPLREISPRDAEHDHGVQIAKSKARIEPNLAEGFECRIAAPEDAGEIANLMQQTFTDYPTPIESEVIREQIATHANRFRVVEEDGQLAACASAEMDHDRRSAELTDCATRRDRRGLGLMAYLLNTLERDVACHYGITDLYTIARADEIGMNCVFSKLGYDYTGRLVNNCRMPNGWESMNVWCKSALSAT